MNTTSASTYRSTNKKIELTLRTYGIHTSYGTYGRPNDKTFKYTRLTLPIGLDVANDPRFLMINIDLFLIGLRLYWLKNV